MILPKSNHRASQLIALGLVLLLTVTPVMAGITITASNGIVMTGADGVTFDHTNGIVMTGADGVLNYGANGIVMTGADGISVGGANGVILTDGYGMLATAGNNTQSGLQTVDPELALQLNLLTDDSSVNAVVVYYHLPTAADLADLQRIG